MNMFDLPDFVQNKYQKWYLCFIEHAKNRQLDGYFEKHHVLPKKLGGDDSSENIVQVTAREHFVLHSLLTRFTVGEARRKMCYALSFFRTNNKNHNRTLNSRQYGVARKALSEARKGAQPSEKCKAAVSKARKGVPVSEEARAKIGQKLQNKIAFFTYYDGILSEEPDFYRFCAAHGVGRANIQAKIKKLGIAVVTAGPHKGRAFSFDAMSEAQALVAIGEQCKKSNMARVNAVKTEHKKRSKKKIAKAASYIPVNDALIHVPSGVKMMRAEEMVPEEVYSLRKQGPTFFFFDDEITAKPQIINSMLNNSVGLNNKVHARKTTLRVLERKEAREFLNANHLQGAGPGAQLYIGLDSQGELVSVMSFGRARYNPSAKHELLRFACKLNITVIGGASKLLKHVSSILDGPIVSYADLRYGNGGVYEKIGFHFHGLTRPGYWYVKNGARYHRTQFQKHKLPSVLENFDPTLTEVKNMQNHGYIRVFDAGHAVFIYDK